MICEASAPRRRRPLRSRWRLRAKSRQLPAPGLSPGTQDRTASPRWPLLVFEEPGPDALRPGPVLMPRQCRQDSGAHYATGDKPGDRGVSSGDDRDQARGRAGKDRGDHGDHSGDRPVDQPAPAAKALDGKPPRWRDAGQVVSELWCMVEVVSPEPRDPFYVFKFFDCVGECPVGGDGLSELAGPDLRKGRRRPSGHGASGRSGTQHEGPWTDREGCSPRQSLIDLVIGHAAGTTGPHERGGTWWNPAGTGMFSVARSAGVGGSH
jgi:hypothetical protein